MQNNNILEINEENFEAEVINASNDSLILVDFWAPWCGPCKQLTPILEKVISNSNNKAKLVKINIDENKNIAAQLRIQSIPTVFFFKDGQPIDAFQGVLAEKKIIEIIEKHLNEKLTSDFSEFYENILKLFNDNKFKNAKEILEGFIAENPNEFRGFAMYIDSLTYLEEFSNAEEFIKSLDEEVIKNSHIKSSLQKLNIKKENSKGPTLNEIKNDLNKDPENIDLILKLSDKYFAENMIDEAFNILLINFKKNKEKTKKKFLEFFEALGNDNPKTLEYRKKLSSLIFS